MVLSYCKNKPSWYMAGPCFFRIIYNLLSSPYNLEFSVSWVNLHWVMVERIRTWISGVEQTSVKHSRETGWKLTCPWRISWDFTHWIILMFFYSVAEIWEKCWEPRIGRKFYLVEYQFGLLFKGGHHHPQKYPALKVLCLTTFWPGSQSVLVS